jgi:hypothetical protein
MLFSHHNYLKCTENFQCSHLIILNVIQLTSVMRLTLLKSNRRWESDILRKPLTRTVICLRSCATTAPMPRMSRLCGRVVSRVLTPKEELQ